MSVFRAVLACFLLLSLFAFAGCGDDSGVTGDDSPSRDADLGDAGSGADVLRGDGAFGDIGGSGPETTVSSCPGEQIACPSGCCVSTVRHIPTDGVNDIRLYEFGGELALTFVAGLRLNLISRADVADVSETIAEGELFSPLVMTPDGSLAVAALGRNGQGGVEVVRGTPGAWTGSGIPEDLFIESVALASSHDGRLVVGAPGRENGVMGSSRLFVLEEDGGSWVTEESGMSWSSAGTHSVSLAFDRDGQLHAYDRTSSHWAEGDAGDNSLTPYDPDREWKINHGSLFAGTDGVVVGGTVKLCGRFCSDEPSILFRATRGTEGWDVQHLPFAEGTADADGASVGLLPDSERLVACFSAPRDSDDPGLFLAWESGGQSLTSRLSEDGVSYCRVRGLSDGRIVVAAPGQDGVDLWAVTP